MKAPGYPANEVERLASLRSYGILDTALDENFDALTTLAARLLGVPIALVSIVDENRQWFKSRYGLEARQTPRDVSFCGHVVQAGVPLQVDDARSDPRFSDNPLVTGYPQVGFYLGMPLQTSDGFVLGTLCAIDQQPRSVTAEQRDTLTLLARQVVALLELHRSHAHLRSEQEALLKRDQELQESKEQLHTLFDGMQEGALLQDRSGAILTANNAACSILGLTLSQLAGKSSMVPDWHCIHEDGSPFPGDDHPSMMSVRTGKPLTNVIMGIHKTATALTWVSVNARPLFKPGSTEAYGVTVTFRDITENRAAASRALQLARQERLVTTGTLAASVGHEINSPLTYVISNLDFSLEEVRDIAGGSPSGRLTDLIEILTEAREGAERVRKIVRGLRSLVRDDGPPVPTDIRPVIDVSMNMSMNEMRPRATVFVSPISAPLVMADESRLTQVLVNLLMNAAQSFTTNDPSRNRVEVTVEANSDVVTICISDNGPGIPALVLKRIFDPFFTTKPIGQGTGLGLSISHSIVLGLGGELACETKEGQGTRFKVMLPIAKKGWPQTKRVAESPLPRGRILVVDDDAAVARSVTRLLQAEHDVISRNDPREALELFKAGQTYDVILCDLMMPHLTGAELFMATASWAPSLLPRFVFISGGVVKEEMSQFLANLTNKRLEKPFETALLRSTIRGFITRED